MAVAAAAAIAGVGIGLYRAISAAKQNKKARKEAERLKPSYYKVQDEYLQNKNLALANAGQGLPSAAKDYITTETQRGLGAGIGAITQSGGSPNDLSKLFDVYRRSVNSVGAQDAQAQLANIQRLMDVNKDIAGQKTIQWSLNEDRSYQNKLKELTERRAAAEQNMWEGVNTAVGSLGALGTATSNMGLIKNMNRLQGAYNGNGRSSDYLASQPVQTDTSQIQPGTMGLQPRQTPNVYPANNGTQDYSNWESDQQDWKTAFDTYQ